MRTKEPAVPLAPQDQICAVQKRLSWSRSGLEGEARRALSSSRATNPQSEARTAPASDDDEPSPGQLEQERRSACMRINRGGITSPRGGLPSAFHLLAQPLNAPDLPRRLRRRFCEELSDWPKGPCNGWRARAGRPDWRPRTCNASSSDAGVNVPEKGFCVNGGGREWRATPLRVVCAAAARIC
ncbi:Hypothetical predicted protein [Podarcis lilfordi]|uniref:Uncharacterized protein n=1 Tax=Podarcis lilfordi TaxID=74358 RepID=A0AA35JRH4_9SAUR|nr:Hypothetical predicted protein [Podarcis lilfordi]